VCVCVCVFVEFVCFSWDKRRSKKNKKEQNANHRRDNSNCMGPKSSGQENRNKKKSPLRHGSCCDSFEISLAWNEI
jgi:hypothetical protein